MNNIIVKSYDCHIKTNHAMGGGQVSFENLPNEIIAKILSNLHRPEDLCAAACLNKRLNRLTIFSVRHPVQKMLSACIKAFAMVFPEKEQAQNENISFEARQPLNPLLSASYVDMHECLLACDSLNPDQYYRRLSIMLADYLKAKMEVLGLESVLQALGNKDAFGSAVLSYLKNEVIQRAVALFYLGDVPKRMLARGITGERVIIDLIASREWALAKEMVYKCVELTKEFLPDFLPNWKEDRAVRDRSFQRIFRQLLKEKKLLLAVQFIKRVSDEDMSAGSKNACLFEIDHALHLYAIDQKSQNGIDGKLRRLEAMSYISDIEKFSNAALVVIRKESDCIVDVLKMVRTRLIDMSEYTANSTLHSIYGTLLHLKQFDKIEILLEAAHEGLANEPSIMDLHVRRWSSIFAYFRVLRLIDLDQLLDSI